MFWGKPGAENPCAASAPAVGSMSSGQSASALMPLATIARLTEEFCTAPARRELKALELTFAAQNVTITADVLSAPGTRAETRLQAKAQAMELGPQ